MWQLARLEGLPRSIIATPGKHSKANAKSDFCACQINHVLRHCDRFAIGRRPDGSFYLAHQGRFAEHLQPLLCPSWAAEAAAHENLTKTNFVAVD